MVTVGTGRRFPHPVPTVITAGVVEATPAEQRGYSCDEPAGT